MPLDISIVGRELDAVEVDLTARRSLAFAAGIDDPAEAGLRCEIASPFQCAAFEWLSAGGTPPGTLGLTNEEAARVVHAAQDSTFLRPLRTGRRYRIVPRIVAARNIRAGALVETEVLTIDAGDDAPVIRTLSSAIYRGTPLTGAAGEGPVRAEIAAAPLTEAIIVPVDRWLPHIYTECADIWNPIHTEPDAARAVGLPDLIVHGTALWALSGSALVRRFAGGDSARAASLAGRFVGMAFPGRPLTLRHGHPDGAGDIAFELVDGEDRPVVAAGRLSLRG